MLLTIVDTKLYGKFVVHVYPFKTLSPAKEATPMELSQCIMNAFEYFGMYQKSDVISTSNGNLKESSVVDLFEANQKYTQVVMGLDENCVIVSKSAFLDSNRQFFQTIQYPSHNIQLGQFISLNDSQSSIINSISIVYRQQNFENIQQVKHKLAFLVSALQTREKHSKYLSRQIALIVEQKTQFKRILKDKCSIYLKQNNTIYQEFKIKMIFKEIHAEAQNILKKIHLFNLLEKIYNSWDRKQFFKNDQLEEFFLTHLTNMNLNIPVQSQIRDKIKLVENKTVVTIPLKNNNVSSVLSSFERADYIEKLLLNTVKPLKNILSNQLQVSAESLYHTVYFLMRNELAVSVFPFDPEKYYSLYTLRSMPDRKVIQKFNNIFKDEDILEYLKKFQKYYRVKYLDEKIKYLMLNKVIKEVTIYIEKLQPVNSTRELFREYKSALTDLKSDKNVISHNTIYRDNTNINRDNNTSNRDNNTNNKDNNTNINYRDNNTSNRNNNTTTNKESHGIQSSIYIKKTDVEAILNQCVTKPQEINVVLAKCRQKNVNMSELINFVKHNSNYWKFIFVQKYS